MSNYNLPGEHRACRRLEHEASCDAHRGYRDDRELEAGAVWALEPRLCATERVDCGRVSDAVFLCGVPEAPLVARAGLPQTNFARSEGRFLASEKRFFATVGLDWFARGCRRV